MAKTSTNPGTTFITVPKGTGETTMFVEDIVGTLIGIADRAGEYEIVDPKTGELVRKPNSFIAHFMNDEGQVRYVNWPAYYDEAGNKMPWSRFDQSIDLEACITGHVRLHAYRDASHRFHLKLATASLSVDNGKQVVTDDELF